ncbi:RNA-binding S4 domain-containing protein [Desulfopila sp. IMCC35006]|uniref:RNA-binding S4 domain-containing protein n=1 Tax=Desulfopila sp. IMCC35006 TaxID=2569542 RepID=UPI0010AC9529|nr:RNA-binding S4 domain-containing protein [Desulfopila sp. IMCC35006]TKB27661.1 RNA-binding S4 domain-containing protein [Desulfopila sp. IMCC35006]
MSAQKKTIKVTTLPIRLGQFLKLADLVQDGIEAKMRIQNGEVMVNNLPETRRGRQLRDLDEITLDGREYIVEFAQ